VAWLAKIIEGNFCDISAVKLKARVITRARNAAGQITMTGRLFYGFILWWMDFLEEGSSKRGSSVKKIILKHSITKPKHAHRNSTPTARSGGTHHKV